jgi:hypothetical protein
MLPLRVLLHYLSIDSPHLALQSSLGFVLGAAITAATFLGAPTHPQYVALGVTLASVIATLYLVSLGLKKNGSIWRHDVVANSNNAFSNLGLVFAGLLVAHLALILAENIARAVYPWDAWTTWIYRAKLWFFNQEIAPLLAPSVWLSEGGPSTGTIAAYDYPAFVSLVALYPASLINEWSDHLVNLPWFLCALALSAGVFGLCRELQISSNAAIFATLALFSAPLFHVHFAMAGYADAWIAATTGLGLACLLGWAYKRQSNVLLYGIIFLILGVFIKREGIVWFALALFWLASWELGRHYPFRTVFGLTIFGSGIASLLFSNWLLPLGPLGDWGISGQQLFLGPLGTFALSNQSVLGLYGASVISQSNWLLLPSLWWFGCCFLAKRHSALVVASTTLITLFWLSQYAIFRYTQLGDYALSGTAINRLLLHILPALTLVIGAAFHEFSRTLSGNAHKLRPWLIAFSLPAVLMLMSVAVLLFATASSGSKPAQNLDKNTLLPFAGQVNWLDKGFRLELASGNVAAAGHRGQPLAGADFPYARVTLDRHPEALSFFYRRQDTPGDFFTIPINSSRALLALHRDPSWHEAVIIEYGIVQGKTSVPLPLVRDVSLLSSASVKDFSAIITAWVHPKPHDYRSINLLEAKTADVWPSLSTTAIIAALLVMVLVLTTSGKSAVSTRHNAGLSSLLLTTLLGLFFWSDALSSWNHMTRLHLNVTANKAPADKPAEIARLIAPHIPTESPVLIFPATSAHQFTALRLSYDLLPHRVMVAPPLSSSNVPALPRDWPGLGLMLDDEGPLRDAVNRVQRSTKSKSMPIQIGDTWILYGTRDQRVPKTRPTTWPSTPSVKLESQ